MIKKREKMINPLWFLWLILSLIPMELGTMMISNIYNLKFALPKILLIVQLIFILHCVFEIKVVKEPKDSTNLEENGK